MNKSSLAGRIMRLFASNQFFWFVIALLGLQAMWIALTGRYPMAFDEDFHLGVIRLYAHHPNPFWDGQAAGGDAFGAVARDPSYLYHFLMSFPYRFVNAITDNLHFQVISLRFLNITFFVIGLIIYRKLLLKTGISKQIAHITLLILVLLPVTPLLASQINYDNVFMPLVGFTLLLTVGLLSKSTRKIFDINMLLLLMLVCLLTSIVKYAFLPILVVVILFSAISLFKKYKSFREFKGAVRVGIKHSSKPVLILLIGANILVGSLFVERYGINLLQYHKPVADCGEVLGYEHCQYYGPWIRDYNLSQNKTETHSNPIAYTYDWAHGMWFRTFFAVDGPRTDFQTRGPLTLPGIGGLIIGFAGLIAFAFTARRIWPRYNRSVLWLFSLVSLGYLCALWLEEFRLYVETGHPVAINGRYLVPVYPFLILFGILGLKELLVRKPNAQIAVAGVAIACLLCGGGALTYVLRSNDAWYWDGNQAINSTNRFINRTVGPITPGYYQQTQFLP